MVRMYIYIQNSYSCKGAKCTTILFCIIINIFDKNLKNVVFNETTHLSDQKQTQLDIIFQNSKIANYLNCSIGLHMNAYFVDVFLVLMS